MSIAERVVTRDVVALSALTLALFLTLAPGIELPSDVLYYAQWARTPSLSYLDHPGGVAWPLAWLPSDARSLALRLLPLLAALAQGVLITRLLTAGRAGRSTGFWLAFACSPLWLAGILLWTPDAPLLLGWHLGLLAIVGGASPLWLVPAALMMTTAKVSGWYHRGGWVLLTRDAPERRRWALLAWGLATVALASTGLESLQFQLGHRGQTPWSFTRLLLGPLEVFGGGLLLLGPGLGVWALLAVFKHRPDRADLWTRCAIASGAPWLVLSLWTHVEANWIAPTVLPLLCSVLQTREERPLRRLPLIVAAQCVPIALLISQLHLSLLPLPNDPLQRLRGWSRWREGFPTTAQTLVLSDRYQWASQVAFYQQLDGATFDAIERGAAVRPCALDDRVQLDVPQALLVWSERAPNDRVRARWPVLCQHGHIDPRSDGGPSQPVWFELRATTPRACRASSPL